MVARSPVPVGLPTAGADLLVRAGVDVRVHAQGYRCGDAHGRGQLGDPAQLLRGLDVELQDAGGQRHPDLVVGFGDAGIDDALRGYARFQRPGDLAARHRVRTQPFVGEQADHRQIAVGLDRVTEQRALARERVAKGGRQLTHRRGRVDVAGCSNGSRDVGQRHGLGMQAPASIAEAAHPPVPDAFSASGGVGGGGGSKSVTSPLRPQEASPARVTKASAARRARRRWAANGVSIIGRC